MGMGSRYLWMVDLLLGRIISGSYSQVLTTCLHALGAHNSYSYINYCTISYAENKRSTQPINARHQTSYAQLGSCRDKLSRRRVVDRIESQATL